MVQGETCERLLQMTSLDTLEIFMAAEINECLIIILKY